MNDLQVTRTPEMVAAEINLIKDQTRKLVLSNSIAIGKKLKEVKEMLEPGQFGKWLAEAVDFSQSTANNLMRVYEEYGADQGVRGEKRRGRKADLHAGSIAFRRAGRTA